jgi:hypothetical protein
MLACLFSMTKWGEKEKSIIFLFCFKSSFFYALQPVAELR